MVEFRALRGGYGRKEVLKGIDLQAEAGQITGILGPNGCGKSTLLKMLCGILPPAQGKILLDGVDMGELSREERARRVAYLAQNHRLPDMTLGQLVLHGRFPHLRYPRQYRPEDRAAAREAMERLGLTELANEPMDRLSGGQQQKAYIAMALAQEAQVIALDEPTTYLDAAHQRQTLELARELAAGGRHVIAVLHDLSQAMEYAHRLVLLEAGTLAAQGTPEELFRSGAPDRVFGITLQCIQTPSGPHYYWK